FVICVLLFYFLSNWLNSYLHSFFITILRLRKIKNHSVISHYVNLIILIPKWFIFFKDMQGFSGLFPFLLEIAILSLIVKGFLVFQQTLNIKSVIPIDVGSGYFFNFF
ncbi:MAG: hypothetical protein QM535_07855, partial [Limnohabitans sp.]|nr:hypothetical protein [Limnohabitans sp.]